MNTVLVAALYDFFVCILGNCRTHRSSFNQSNSLNTRVTVIHRGALVYSINIDKRLDFVESCGVLSCQIPCEEADPLNHSFIHTTLADPVLSACFPYHFVDSRCVIPRCEIDKYLSRHGIIAFRDSQSGAPHGHRRGIEPAHYLPLDDCRGLWVAKHSEEGR